MTMGASKQRGFTIIEVSLFLAVSGLLIIGLFVAIGGSLNAQRYRDTTQSLKSLIQKQYSDLINTQNSRINTGTCDDSTASATSTGSTVTGQSNCLLIGRYMRIDRGDITLYNVLGVRKSGAISGLNDISALRSTGDYRLNVSMIDVQRSQIDWGGSIAWPASGSGARTPRDRTIGILFVRSPDSGRTYTFSSDTLVTPGTTGVSATAFDSMLVAGDAIPGQGSRTICIISNGLVRNDFAIYFAAYANSASAIELKTNEFMKAHYSGAGSASQC